MMCEGYTKCNFMNHEKVSACANCNRRGKSDDFFISISLGEQIASIIDKNFDEISRFRELMKNSTVDIMDTYNSGHIQKIVERNENVYSVILNTDGVSIVQSNNTSFRPVLLTCNFLPPEVRFKDQNIIVVALYYGKKLPSIRELLRPLAKEMRGLSSGIFVRESYFEIFVTMAVLDLPAKSKVSEVMQFNAKQACNFCLQTGEPTSKGIR